jgi:Tfp pilus assembly protein PilF
VERDPSAHAAWQALSVAAVRAGMPDIAVVRAKRAVALERGNADYLNSLGVAHGEASELTEAEQAFRRALKLKPSYAEAHYNLARVLRRQGRLDDALREYERAHALQPAARVIELGLAAIYRQLGRPDLALRVLRAAPGAAMPDEDRISHVTLCIADVEGPDAAASWLRELLAQRPDLQAAHYILAQFLLALGRWREGWKEHLWHTRGELARGRPAPTVLPSRLDGKRVVLRAEYGIGDVLFFLRFAGELRDRGAQVALECPPLLAKLAALLDGDVEIAQATASDMQICVADLPSLLETEATPAAFALRADDRESVRARGMLASLGPPPYLGLTWRAGTKPGLYSDSGSTGAVRLFKEIPPELLGQVARGWPGTVVSFQREPRQGDLEAVQAAAGATVHDLGRATDDLRQALGLLAQLDDYVGVSNTNVHLLAGMGRSARVLVTEPPEWRWMLGQEGSVWFPGFSVYRQARSLEWPLDRLRADLARVTSRQDRGAG